MLSNCGDREDSWKSLERLLKVPWTARRSNQSILNKNQPWIFIGRTDAETQILWPPDVKNWLIRKEPYAGKDLGQGKWATEDEMVGCHHWLNGHECEQSLGDSKGQWSLVCCSTWGCKELDMTKQMNYNLININTCYFLLFDNSHSNRYETVSHWGFELYFPNN